MNIVANLPADHIGDTLVVFPILSALRARYEDAHITFVSYALVLPLAQAWGLVDEVLDGKDEQWKELSSSKGIHSPTLLELFDRITILASWSHLQAVL